MPKIQLDLTDEQNKKLNYLKVIFECKDKKEVIRKLIDLTKIKSLKEQKIDVMEAFD